MTPGSTDPTQTRYLVLRRNYHNSLEQKRRELQASWKRFTEDRSGSEGLTELRRLSHRLAGSGASYGYDNVSDAAAALERHLRSFRPGDPMSPEWGALLDERVEQLLSQILAALGDA
jgi:HPt (histidine-containing phosphotransfer) domain-containing protein